MQRAARLVLKASPGHHQGLTDQSGQAGAGQVVLGVWKWSLGAGIEVNLRNTRRCRRRPEPEAWGLELVDSLRCRVPLSQFLKDPAQHVLEALDQDSPAEDDAWEPVSEVSTPEQEQRALSRAEGAPPTL